MSGGNTALCCHFPTARTKVLSYNIFCGFDQAFQLLNYFTKEYDI